MMRRLLARLAPILAIGACSPGDRGALEPIAGPQVTIASTRGIPNDTARLTSGGVRADVTGRWSNANESIEVVYAASMPTTVSISGGSTWKGATAAASGAWDATEPEPGNVMGRPVLGTKLRLAAGERRTVLIIYDRPGEGNRPEFGDELTITVPMPDGLQTVRFRLNGE